MKYQNTMYNTTLYNATLHLSDYVKLISHVYEYEKKILIEYVTTA